ncbi:2Fe-2S iron-sulfur cluster-binding protein [Novosphingobium terrae]|uniref:2Fe-2S iron-sulfur cluster-binding protein n=1 Tax=Novosphingobium terrae TaxID=2726189 RepID=UPI00197D526E|nr:2Fe-2S iron-sulfur cluster-binding protein [Novosphingobium terrae]
MANLYVIDLNGVETQIKAAPGITLMEALRDHGFDDLLALCGGCCSCATCHVYVEAGPESMKTPASPDEEDLLDSSLHRQNHSRLSCQIAITQDLDAIRVRLAPTD